MTTIQLSIQQALDHLDAGTLPEGAVLSPEPTERVEALDALRLGEAGVDVPEELIDYDDAAIEGAEDEAFEGPWEPITSDREAEAEFLRLEVRVDSDVRTWLMESNVDVRRLVEKLLTDAYKTTVLVKR